MKMLVLIPLVYLLSCIVAEGQSPIRMVDGTVTKVVDGDTVQLTDSLGTKLKVRLYGIDAPETEKRNHKTGVVAKEGQPHGAEAFSALRRKVEGRRVTAEVVDLDGYRRAVSLLRLSGRDVNAEMVREGHAWAYRRYLGRAYASRYIGAEEEARREGRGLWQQANPHPPWEFRRMQKVGRR